MLHRSYFILLLFLLLSGCQSAGPKTSVNIQSHLHDELFPNSQSVQVESPEEIFALTPAMQSFVHAHVLREGELFARVKSLATGIFEHADISILYQNDANTIAADTFATGKANCLSLTIMTYALANYAKLGVNFQQVHVPDLWVLRDGASMLNRHVNLKLFHKPSAGQLALNRSYTVDFNQGTGGRSWRRTVISKEYVLAMFYNNNGVDALLNNNYDEAYAYFKNALQMEPSFMDTYTNLGVLYRRIGQNGFAEHNFLTALKLKPGDHSALENLAGVYRVTGREPLANEIQQKLAIQRRSNPYYHYLLGMQSLEQQQPDEAKSHLRRAIELQSGNHEFYFAMARTLYILGETESSSRYMELAKKYSHTKSDEIRYEYKLRGYSQLSKNQQ